jgi:hypothetical protein
MEWREERQGNSRGTRDVLTSFFLHHSCLQRLLFDFFSFASDLKFLFSQGNT